MCLINSQVFNRLSRVRREGVKEGRNGRESNSVKKCKELYTRLLQAFLSIRYDHCEPHETTVTHTHKIMSHSARVCVFYRGLGAAIFKSDFSSQGQVTHKVYEHYY